MKRVIDLVGAGTILFMLSPLMVIISVLIYLNMGSPIFFKQKRPGKHGLPFYIYKFRTMNFATDAQGNLLPGKDRLTSIGRWLRKYSLDELPQLINVIKGELSLVGPRPLLMEYLPLYTKEQARRHDVKPGITGWAQINGRNSIDWETKFNLDVWYVDNHSVWLDIKILFLTFKKVIKKEGVSSKHHYSMKKFSGMHYEQK